MLVFRIDASRIADCGLRIAEEQTGDGVVGDEIGDLLW
jgi:hypothetical protein